MIAFAPGLAQAHGNDTGQYLRTVSAPRSRQTSRVALTPEEDAIGDPGGDDEEIDDLLPADLWYRALCGAVR